MMSTTIITAAELATQLNATPTAPGEWLACCPAHNDTHPSLAIAAGKNEAVLLRCRSQNCSFNAITSALGIHPRQLMGQLPKVPGDTDGFFGCTLADYAKSKGLDIAFLKSCGVTDETRTSKAGKQYPSVRIPYRDPNGLERGVQYRVRLHRASEEKDGRFLWEKGSKTMLYGLDRLNAAKTAMYVVVVEGASDQHTLSQAGFPALGLPGCGQWKEARDTKHFVDIATVFVCLETTKPDGTADPGAKAFYQSFATSAIRDKVKFFSLGRDKDPSGLYLRDRANFKANMQAALDNAVPFAEFVPPAEWGTVGKAEQVTSAPPSTLAGKIVKILLDPHTTTMEKKTHIANAVIAHLLQRGKFYYHKELQDHASAMYFDRKSRVLLLLKSDRFQSWLASFTGLNRQTPIFAFVLAAIEDETLIGTASEGIIPCKFWSATSTAVYISNGDGRAVKITAGKAETVDNGTDGMLFASGFTLAPWQLTTSRDPFVSVLWAGMNGATPYSLDLLRLWVLAMPFNPTCKPPLVMAGAIRSGKTAAARGVFALYGISEAVAKAQEGDSGEGNFWTSLDAGGVTIFDNVDSNIKWLPDALAAAATGGSCVKRRLYTDSDRCQLRANAWVILTTANPMFAADAGLADRLLVVRMHSRDAADTAEAALFDEIRQTRNEGLSFIVNAIKAVLADTAPAPRGLNARHPDWAALAWKLGRAIGRQAEAEAAIKGAEADKSAFMLENDDLGKAIVVLLQYGSFSGNATELARRLAEVDSTFDINYWTPRKIGRRLAKIRLHLSAVATVHEGNTCGCTTYTMAPKVGLVGLVGLEGPFSGKVRENENAGTLYPKDSGNPTNPTYDTTSQAQTPFLEI